MDLDIFGLFPSYKATIVLTTEPPIKSGDKIRGVFSLKAKKNIDDVSFKIMVWCRTTSFSDWISGFEDDFIDIVSKEIIFFDDIKKGDTRSAEYMLPFKDFFTKKRYKEYEEKMKKNPDVNRNKDECDKEFSGFQWTVELYDRTKLQPLQVITLDVERKFIITN